MDKAALAALPFAGLGICLAPVAARAEAMVLVRVRPAPPRVRQGHRDAPRPSGYVLLVELSREIRGR